METCHPTRVPRRHLAPTSRTCTHIQASVLNMQTHTRSAIDTCACGSRPTNCSLNCDQSSSSSDHRVGYVVYIVAHTGYYNCFITHTIQCLLPSYNPPTRYTQSCIVDYSTYCSVLHVSKTGIHQFIAVQCWMCIGGCWRCCIMIKYILTM